jgi:hypothetical protein
MKIILIIAILLHAMDAFAAEQLKIPPIQDVHKEALNYARLSPDDLSDLKRRSKKSALLPSLQISGKRTLNNDIDISVTDNVSVTSSGVNIGPETNSVGETSNADSSIEVKAVWSLRDLVFSSDLLDIAEEARYQVRERRQIFSDINKLYFELERLLPRYHKKERYIDLKVDYIISELDSFTGGWFSHQIK